MNALVHACRLNNSAVYLLQEQQQQQSSHQAKNEECRQNMKTSIEYLHKALSIMKSLATQYEATETTPNPASFVGSPFKEGAKGVVSNQEESYYMYDRPLLLDPSSAFMQQPSSLQTYLEALLPIYSAIVVYNIALIYHETGRQGNSKALHRAVTMYKMCLQLFDNAPYRSVTTTTLATLVLNNCAAVYYEELQYDTCRVYLNNMSRVIQTATTGCNDVHFGLVLTESIIQSLMLNVMLMTPPTIAHAA